MKIRLSQDEAEALANSRVPPEVRARAALALHRARNSPRLSADELLDLMERAPHLGHKLGPMRDRTVLVEAAEDAAGE